MKTGEVRGMRKPRTVVVVGAGSRAMIYARGAPASPELFQVVGLADGATGSFSMNGEASASGRCVHLTGTLGEVEGVFEHERFTLSQIAPEHPDRRVCRVTDVSGAQHGNAHGLGDQAIVRDFVRLLNCEETPFCATTLEDSMVGHQIAFLAEASRMQDGAPLHSAGF